MIPHSICSEYCNCWITQIGKIEQFPCESRPVTRASGGASQSAAQPKRGLSHSLPSLVFLRSLTRLLWGLHPSLCLFFFLFQFFSSWKSRVRLWCRRSVCPLVCGSSHCRVSRRSIQQRPRQGRQTGFQLFVGTRCPSKDSTGLMSCAARASSGSAP